VWTKCIKLYHHGTVTKRTIKVYRNQTSPRPTFALRGSDSSPRPQYPGGCFEEVREDLDPTACMVCNKALGARESYERRLGGLACNICSGQEVGELMVTALKKGGYKKQKKSRRRTKKISKKKRSKKKKTRRRRR